MSNQRKNIQHKYNTSEKGKTAHSNYRKSSSGRFSILKRSAKLRGIEVSLSIEEFKNILENNDCFYCDGNIGPGIGLDRINNKIGYTYSNVKPCCYNCNILRNNQLSVEETLRVIALLKIIRETEDIWM